MDCAARILGTRDAQHLLIRRILEHLGLWAPLPTERSPPVDPASWPPYEINASEQPG
ncbi:MAG: hypothetical protein Q7R45_03260 [Sulfuricaulis sp.]|nr:hypothetical protein [Sulfuricaulis sp.]